MSRNYRIPPVLFPDHAEKQMAYEMGYRAGLGYLRIALQTVLKRETPNPRGPRGRPAKRMPRPTPREETHA